MAEPVPESGARRGDGENAKAREGDATRPAREGRSHPPGGSGLRDGRRGGSPRQRRSMRALGPEEAVRVELHLLEIAGEVARRGVALVRVLRKTALNDPANGCGKAWDERGERLGLLADDGRESLSRG